MAELNEYAVFDVDWLIDSFEIAAEPHAVSWKAFRDAWLAVAHGLAQSRRHVVLLGPFTPDQLEPLPARRWISEIHFAVLDCPDDIRRARLEARPLWRERAIEEQLVFAAHLRSTAHKLFDTGADHDPSETAAQLALWVRGTLV